MDNIFSNLLIGWNEVIKLQSFSVAMLGSTFAVSLPFNIIMCLIGVTRVSRPMFAGVPWGTEGVMARTRTNLRRLGLRWHELPRIWDVDRPADYARLLRSRLLQRKP